MNPKLRVMLVVVAIVLPLDQATKWLVSANVSQLDPVVVIDGFFQITHARNPGMALGWFRDLPVAFFVVTNLIALAAVVSVFRQFGAADRHAGLALGLIVAGALGNLSDRIFRGSVLDFLQFDLQVFVFPDFNVADSAIVVGVVLLLLDIGASGADGTREAPRPLEEPER